MEDKIINEIVEKLAKRMKICNSFSDIVIIKDKNFPSVAGVNSETHELVINLDNEFMPVDDVINHIEGVVIHEAGHTDKRIAVPASAETMKEHLESLKKNKISKEKVGIWLNLAYDLEIHYQYNHRNFIKPKLQRKLKKFLTYERNILFESNPNDIILSVEYPQTDEQKFVKKIIEDRSLNIVDKVTRLARNKKLNQPNSPSKTQITQLIDGDTPQKKGKGKQKKSTKGNQQPQPNMSKGIKIKKKIENKNKENEIIAEMRSLGFNMEETDMAMKKIEKTDLIDAIHNLKESFNTVLPNLEHEASKQKTNALSKDIGNRMNGYRRLNDVSDLTKNVEDMVTVGKYDINEVRIPFRVDRKCKANILVVRDTSGSVTSPPIDKMVRDITVALVTIAKKNRHKVGVVDFHSSVDAFRDKNNNIITTDYNPLLLESMLFKEGYNTRMDLAIDFINKNIIENHKDVPLNVFIVTDGCFRDVEETIKAKKLNVVGFQVDSSYGYNAFPKLIEKHKGRMFKVSKEKHNELISKLFKDYRSG